MSRQAPGSVTQWLGRLQAGDPAAAQQLWERYFRRLVELARQRLRGKARRAADEEDAVLSAFDTFFRGVGEGRFPKLHDRDDLWSLLVALTARKAVDLVRHEARQKRGGPRPGQAADAGPAADARPDPALDDLFSREPTPEFAAQVADACEHLLGVLGDPGLRRVALWKMEGYTNEEIAARLGCVLRTVERKLQVIRRLWDESSPLADEAAPAEPGRVSPN